MRIVITVEDSQLPPGASRDAMNTPAENAGSGPGAATFTTAVSETATDPSEAALTAGATSAGPAPDPPSMGEPAFSPGPAETNPVVAAGSGGSTDLSAGPAPRID